MTKIAFPTNNGKTINPHFGRAQYYLVVTLDEDKNELEREQRPKAHHTSDAHHHEPGHHPPEGIFDPLTDCDLLIAGGMGPPAYRNIQQLGINLLLTGERKIEVALKAYLNKSLSHEAQLVHRHDDHHH